MMPRELEMKIEEERADSEFRVIDPRNPSNLPSITHRFISLGAGVQSTTLALMAGHGEFDSKPDGAIFSDTGQEPQRVYEHLDWLEGRLKELDIPVHRIAGVHKGKALNITEQMLRYARGESFVFQIPFFSTPRGKTLKRGQLPRQCTQHLKITPIRRKVRELVGITGKKSPDIPVIEQWIGISLDESIRCNDTGESWRVNRWPLIEKGMGRKDCVTWLKAQGYKEPPKSSCIACPFKSDAQWRDLRDNHPEEWEMAVKLDEAVRHGGRKREGKENETICYLHPSMRPLREIELSPEEEGQADMFNSHCDGHCGV